MREDLESYTLSDTDELVEMFKGSIFKEASTRLDDKKLSALMTMYSEGFSYEIKRSFLMMEEHEQAFYFAGVKAAISMLQEELEAVTEVLGTKVSG